VRVSGEREPAALGDAVDDEPEERIEERETEEDEERDDRQVGGWAAQHCCTAHDRVGSRVPIL
jgi:hypothetical protein